MDFKRKRLVEDLLGSVPEYIKKVRCDTEPNTRPFKCAVPSCTNHFLEYDPNSLIKYHNFPSDPEMCMLWKEKLSLSKNFNVKSAKVCSRHFTLNDYMRNYKAEFTDPAFKRNLKCEAIPTVEPRAAPADIESLESFECPLPITEAAEPPKTTTEPPTRMPIPADVPYAQIKEMVDKNEALKLERQKLWGKLSALEAKLVGVDARIKSRGSEINNLNYRLSMKKNISGGIQQIGAIKKVFSEAQLNKLAGKQKVVWSDDDLAMAFTIRHIGSKECYLYLKNTLNFPLPSLSCVQRWMASCKTDTKKQT